MIWIKNIKIFKDINKKENSFVYSFNTIISLKYLPNNHISKIKSFFTLISAFILKPTISLSISISFLFYITLNIGKLIITRFG